MKCEKCGTHLSDTAAVCHACGHLLPRNDDLQLAPATERPRSPLLSELAERDDEEKSAGDLRAPLDREASGIAFEAERKFNDYWLPTAVLLVSLVLYVAFSLRHFGPANPAAWGLDLAVLLLEVLLTVLGMQLLVLAFSFDLGLLRSSTLKLCAFALAGWAGLAAVGVVTDETFTPSDGMEQFELNPIDGTQRVKQTNDFLNLPYWSILVAAVALVFQLALLRIMFGLGVLELLPIGLANWLLGAGLYFVFRQLFKIPGWF